MTKEKTKPKVSVKLEYPVQWGSELITEVYFNRPKGKALKNFGKDITMGQLMGLAAHCSGFTPGLFEDMDASDSLKCVEVVGDFLESGRKTGKAS